MGRQLAMTLLKLAVDTLLTLSGDLEDMTAAAAGRRP